MTSEEFNIMLSEVMSAIRNVNSVRRELTALVIDQDSETVDAILSSIDPGKVSGRIMMMVLIETRPLEAVLKFRERFYRTCLSELTKRNGQHKACRLLKSLR